MEDKKFGWIDLYNSIWYFLGKHKLKFILWNVILISIYLIQLIPPYIIGLIVDFFTEYNKGESLFWFYVGISTLALISALTAVLRLTAKYHLGKCTNDIIYSIRTIGFEKIANMPLLHNSKESTGSKMQKIQNGTEAFTTFTELMYNRFYMAITSVIGTIFIFIFLKPVYIIFLLSFYTGFIVILKVFSGKLEKLNYLRNVSQEQASGSFVDGLRNILTIKSSGSENEFQKHINDKEWIKKEFDDNIIETSNIMWRSYYIFSSVAAFVFLFFMGSDVLNEVISVGSIVIFYSYFTRVTFGGMTILGMHQTLLLCKTKFSRMMPIFKQEIENRKHKNPFPQNWETISFNKVVFQYKKQESQNKSGINNMDFKIRRNKKIGIAGQSGSGKSTLARLLMGLYPLDSGTYSIDSTKFSNINTPEIFKNMCLVLQETEMFNFSLNDNITLKHAYDPLKFDKAVRVAQLEEVISQLPQGKDTILGEKGYTLSGGERQRVAIARAVYRDVDIMIFDEATSSLDSATEEKIQRALEDELTDRTLIFIAHRLDTLKNMDRILVLKKGNIIEQGTFTELLQYNNSLFTELYKKNAR